MIGSRIGHYEITTEIGRGGMGEVYRARDTRLNRDVALKILPQVFAQNSERMARFEREAQVLASLNHANIAQIYGIEGVPGAVCREPGDKDPASNLRPITQNPTPKTHRHEVPGPRTHRRP